MRVQPVPRDRFTIDGDAELERHLESVCREVRAGVGALIPPSRLSGLLLGGGYGRGEGGVLRTGSGDRPYNDLEFYVLVQGNALLAERRYGPALQALGHRLSPTAGLEVEFKVLTPDKLQRAATSMFFYDLLLGHRWLLGDDTLLAGCGHHRDARDIPCHEATRLLMNRCSGLLFSAERLRRSRLDSGDLDFVGRNLAKVQLALGDVVLAESGRYHWSCRERHVRLADWHPLGTPPWREDIRRHHAEGVAFKLHPVCTVARREELAERHAELSALARRVWLWLENLRLGTHFETTRDYALGTVDKCPESSPLRNRLIHARTFGPASAFLASGARYPRQRLFHALCLLLWEDGVLSDTALLKRAQRELGTRAEDFAGLVAAYEQLWHRFN